jgi:predicted nucleic acid-binding protein
VQPGDRIRVILADVGPLYAAFDPSDEYHTTAQRGFQVREDNSRLVAVLWTTVAEGHSTVLRNLGVRHAANWLENVTSDVLLLVLEADDYVAARGQVARFSDRRLTVFDALLYVFSEWLGIPVWTYDHHVDVLGANRWYPE